MGWDLKARNPVTNGGHLVSGNMGALFARIPMCWERCLRRLLPATGEIDRG